MSRGFSRKSTRGQGKKGNVMTPLNWMAGVSETLLISASSFSDNKDVTNVFVWFAVAVAVFYAAMYVYFAIKDPNRLQTEEFNLASQEMKLMVNHSIEPGTLKIEQSKNTQIIDVAKEDNN